MSGQLTIGVDIGTTNVKAVVLDTGSGKVLATGSREHPLSHPKPGWAEQDPNAYWGAAVSAIQDCLAQAPHGSDIAAIGLSGLVGVTLPIGEHGNVLRPAMIWMDARSEPECEDIRRAVGEEMINRNNGNRIAPWFIEPKALWIKKHEPHIFGAIVGRHHPWDSLRVSRREDFWIIVAARSEDETEIRAG